MLGIVVVVVKPFCSTANYFIPICNILTPALLIFTYIPDLTKSSICSQCHWLCLSSLRHWRTASIFIFFNCRSHQRKNSVSGQIIN